MNEKNPNIFARMGLRIARWFRETKSELKKVVWPNRKQIVNNTAIVLVALVLVGAVMAGLDYIFTYFIHSILPGAADLIRG